MSEEIIRKDLTDKDLLLLFQAASSIKRLHSEPNGLEEHRKFAEQRLEIYRAEILRRMQKD